MTKNTQDKVIKTVIASLITATIIGSFGWLFSQQIVASEKFVSSQRFLQLEEKCVFRPEFTQVCKQQDERYLMIQKSLERIEKKLDK